MQLYKLMLEYFGKKASGQRMSPEKQEITIILYDSFVFKFGFDEQYHFFWGRLMLDDYYNIARFLGEKLSKNDDKYSILDNFRIIDNFCRLRLPDKFLEAYDKYLATTDETK